MPTYCYRCSSCNHEYEIMQKISEVAISECPKCHKETSKRVPSKGISLQFKGSGFYITDYPKEGGCGKSSCDCKS
jgi:putative FmdB family regulatory protein